MVAPTALIELWGFPTSNMKITKIDTLVVNARMRNWVLVKVETDQPGLYGWGEATLEWKTRAVVGAIEDLSVLLIGQDPRRIEHLWQIMHRQYFWRGGIINMSAMSGIDQALWDIKGKDLGKPVCELLGGPVRDSCGCTTISAVERSRECTRPPSPRCLRNVSWKASSAASPQ